MSFALLMFSLKIGRYQICYIITIVGIFILLFPVLFLSSNGYHSGMPTFCVFAVVFTVFMLEGKKAIFFSVFEVILYVAVCIICYLCPELVTKYELEQKILIDVVISMVASSAVLGVCLYLHFRLYNEQQRKLDEQNAILTQVNLKKTEFLANASHEMRTPLTVTSVNIQTVMEILEDIGDTVRDTEAGKLLQGAQNEIMRLSRMVGGMLTLASISENTDKQRLDLTSLLQSGIEMMRLNLDKHGNIIETDIELGLSVFGNADLLVQVLTNILQNAGAHTQNGVITVNAKNKGNEIIVEVRDTGAGISPLLLPHVFERGVSLDGTGVGLYLCKTVVESHGGRIGIESEPGKGTTVHYTFPVYEGQFGEANI